MDQDAIEVQPLFKSPFSKGIPEASVNPGVGKVGMHINRDLSEISMF